MKKTEKVIDSFNLPELKPGDIIQYHTRDWDGTMWNWLYWSHTIMYIGEGEIIHSSGNGVERLTLEEKLESVGPGLDNIAVLRLKETVSVDMDRVIDFALQRIGRNYDLFSLYLFTKQKDFPFRPMSGYYCTELIWAAYYSEHIDLDLNRVGWVRPLDIYESKHLEKIYVKNPEAVIIFPGLHRDKYTDDEEEVYYAETVDGWKLGIKRYRPKTDQVSKYPVILCHGLAANKNSCDFGMEGSEDWNQYSLAAYLSQGGNNHSVSFDVWVPELRGRGRSKTFDPFLQPNKYSWCLDEYVDYDIPAIIDRVKNQYIEEKKEQVKPFWIGKSMGGMLAYAFDIYPRKNSSHFKGVVTIGSPVKFENSASMLSYIPNRLIYKISGPINFHQLLLMIDNNLIDCVFTILGNKNHMEPDIYEQFIRENFDNPLSSSVFKHFAVMETNEVFCRFPHSPGLFDFFNRPYLKRRYPLLRDFFAPFSYTDHLSDFTCPLLVVAGKGDSIADVGDVKYAFDQVSSADKSFLLFEKDAVDDQGNKYSSFDYGHMDLNMGRKAKDEVYTKIHDWLIKQESKES